MVNLTDWFGILRTRSVGGAEKLRLATGLRLMTAKATLAREFDIDASAVYFAPCRRNEKQEHPALQALAIAFQERCDTWRMLRRGSVNGAFQAVAPDGADVAAMMRDYVLQHRLELGDDGAWRVHTLRAFLDGKAGLLMSELSRAEDGGQRVEPGEVATPDFSDELGGYRFPSLSILRGFSQPLSKLRGECRFRHLFIHDGPGVYIAFDGNVPLYVGMAQRLSQRLKSAESHHKLKHVLAKHPNSRIAAIPYPIWDMPEFAKTVTSTDQECAWAKLRRLLFSFETACIKHYQPSYNRIELTAMLDVVATPVAEDRQVVHEERMMEWMAS